MLGWGCSQAWRLAAWAVGGACVWGWVEMAV